MDSKFLGEIIDVLNIIEGRSLWEIRDSKLSSNNMTKAVTKSNADGTSDQELDVRKIYLDAVAIEQLELSIKASEKTCMKGKQLLKEARQQQAKDALNNVERMFGKETVEQLLVTLEEEK